METRRHGLPLYSAVLGFIAVDVVVQLWLLQAALDARRAGHPGVAVAAAIGSVALFAVNGALLLHGLRFDRRLREEERSARDG